MNFLNKHNSIKLIRTISHHVTNCVSTDNRVKLRACQEVKEITLESWNVMISANVTFHMESVTKPVIIPVFMRIGEMKDAP